MCYVYMLAWSLPVPDRFDRQNSQCQREKRARECPAVYDKPGARVPIVRLNLITI